MFDGEMNIVEGFLEASGYYGETQKCWNRLKKGLAELSKTPTKKQNAPCPVGYMHDAKKGQGALYCRHCNKLL